MLVVINLEGGCYAIVEGNTVEEAERWARWEFGNSNVTSAREATKEDVEWYKSWNGRIHEVEPLEGDDEY